MSSSCPEQNVLRCIARRELDSQVQDELRLLIGEKLDWEYLISNAAKHGLASLLHKHLAGFVALVPNGVLAETKRAAVENSQSVLHLTARLLKLYKAFSDKGIPLAIFKGAILSQLAYGELALRRAGDIDVLIRPEDFSKAKTLLEELGFVMVPSLTPAQLQSHVNFHCEIQFMCDDWFTIVDLHWKLSPKSFCFDLTATDVMCRLQSVDIAGTQMKTFGTEDLILYLTMHGAKHLWHRLEWISSLSEVIRSSPEIDWSAICDRAERVHGRRMLALGLRLADEAFGTEVPADVLAAIDSDESLLALAKQTNENMFSGRLEHLSSTHLALHNLKVTDRKRDFLKSLLRAIYTPTLADFEAISLPESLNALYYGFRPLRLSKAYASLLFQRRSH